MACGKAKIGKPAPAFNVDALMPDTSFKKISLNEFKGKYLVLFFYPADFTFVCPTEILAFNDRVDEFRAINCEVLSGSPDSKFAHFAWVQTSRKEGGLGPMKIPLLSDLSKTISRDYGIEITDGDDEGHCFRGLFIISDKGILRQITINDLPVGRSVDETLRLVKAFQFSDVHGEVCPAGWTPGQHTIIPNLKDSKKYFAEANKGK